jgi:hypothetical protein
VADGATEASFSGLWAAMLVQAFGRGRIPSRRLVDALAPLQAAWWSVVREKPLPWYAEEKLRSGAFSSLLGITLAEPRDGGDVRWSALAIGDSCLGLVRGGKLLTAFPVRSSEDFHNSPHLISSAAVRNEALQSVLCLEHGSLLPGDDLYLLTDALACWFLACHEQGGEPWQLLESAAGNSSQEQFGDWIAGERREHRMRNDDVTMLRLRLE